MADQDHGKLHLGWDFPAFVRQIRSRRWFVIAGIIGGASFLFAVLTQNFLFAIILVIIAIIILLQHRELPRQVSFGLTEDGLEVGSDFFAYDELKNFWIAYKPPEVKKLYVTFKGALRPMLIIPFENQNPIRVRKILLDYLPEDTEQEDETTTEALGRLLKL